MSTTFWDSFDNLIKEAENEFLNFNYDKAIELWQNYFKITAKNEYEKIIKELNATWSEEIFKNVSNLPRLFNLFQNFNDKYFNKEISHYTFQLYVQLIIKIYKQDFQNNARNELNTETGVFEYMAGNNQLALKILKSIIDSNQEAIIARIYLGYTFMALKDQRSTIATLSQNLVLDADKLRPDDLYLSQFKLLFGRLFSSMSNTEEAAWLMMFESWFRNWLIFDEDKKFFELIRKKETNERIVQVKYYSYERYRHFARCLYIAEYARHYLKKDTGLILEQENYMEKLDQRLFERYRKKRKEIKQSMRNLKTA